MKFLRNAKAEVISKRAQRSVEAKQTALNPGTQRSISALKNILTDCEGSLKELKVIISNFVLENSVPNQSDLQRFQINQETLEKLRPTILAAAAVNESQYISQIYPSNEWGWGSLQAHPKLDSETKTQLLRALNTIFSKTADELKEHYDTMASKKAAAEEESEIDAIINLAMREARKIEAQKKRAQAAPTTPATLVEAVRKPKNQTVSNSPTPVSTADSTSATTTKVKPITKTDKKHNWFVTFLLNHWSWLRQKIARWLSKEETPKDRNLPVIQTKPTHVSGYPSVKVAARMTRTTPESTPASTPAQSPQPSPRFGGK